MEKPDEVPDDVWDLAREAFSELFARYVIDGQHEFQTVVVIALAIIKDRDARNDANA